MHPTTAFIVFSAILLISGVLWHVFLPRFDWATLAGSLTAVVVFNIIISILLGYIHPFLWIPIIFELGFSLPICLLIGLPILAARRARLRRSDEHQ